MCSQLFFSLDDENCNFVSGDDENNVFLIHRGKKYSKILNSYIIMCHILIFQCVNRIIEEMHMHPSKMIFALKRSKNSFCL